MIVKNTELLSRFKTQNFCKLTIKEKKELVVEFINAIIKERNLSPVNISFVSDDFGYEPNSNTLRIDERVIQNDSLNSNYVLITGVIHELRHKEQVERGNDSNLFYTGRTSSLSPKEMDAHLFASNELLEMADFFNDNEFDKYVYILMNTDFKEINEAKNYYLMCGYSNEEIPEVCKRQAQYTNLFLTESNDEKHSYIYADGKLYDLSTLSIPELVELQKKVTKNPVVQITNFPGKGITILSREIVVAIKDNQVYVVKNIGHDIPAKDVLKRLQNLLSFLIQNRQEIGISEVNTVHFPPLGFIDDKEPKEKIYLAMGIENGSTEIQKLLAINPEMIDLENIIINSVSSKSNIKRLFGVDYQERYSLEQQEFLLNLVDYIDAYESYVAFNNEDAKEIIGDGYFAIGSYKPEFSLEKLKLIFEAQKEGLNTMYYDNLTENQVRELMDKQRTGVSREEIIEFISSFKVSK